MTAYDLRPVPRSDLKWDTEHAEASLNSLFEQAEQHGVHGQSTGI